MDDIELGNRLRQDLQDAQGQLDDLYRQAGQGGGPAGDQAGGNFLSGFSGAIGSLGSKAGPIGAALVGVASIGLAAGAVLAQAVADGMEQERVRDRIQAQLGINEATAENIGRAAGAAYANGWGESVEANMDAARLAIQNGILTGEEDTATFASTIENLDIITQKLNGDVSQSVQAVGALMANGLATDAQHAFDIIARGSDGTANKGEDLLDVIREYSAGWSQAGFDAEFALAMISQATDLGVDNADRAGDALREFGRRMYEDADVIKEAITNLHLPADELFEQLRSGGEAGEQAFDRIFDAIREIEDPLERATIAQQLLGDTAGDFIGVFTQWDPSNAVRKFGEVEGAAARTGDTMSSNTASAFDEASRSIEVSLDSIKLALAEAFGPELTKVADWVSTHKPELMNFFFELADAALLTGEGFLRFVSMSINAIGPFTAIIAEAFSGALNSMGTFVSGAASVADALGMDGMANSLRSAGDSLYDYADKAQQGSAAMFALADSIDNDVIPGLSGLRAGLRESGDGAVATAEMMRALGNTVVTEIPDEKSIIIEDNSPEAIERLEALGFKVENTPDGITVTADTAEAENIITGFINTQRSTTVWVDIQRRKQDLGIAEGQFGPYYDPGSGQSFADGGIDDRAAQIRAGRGRGVTWAEAETGWEAYIPGAQSKRRRSEQILQEVADRFGFGLVKMADGGITEGGFNSQAAVAKAMAHDGEGYVYGGLDCSGYLSAVFNAGTGQNVRFTTDSDFEGMGWVPGFDPDGFSIGTNKGSGPNGHMSGYLYGTNIESDGSNGIQYGRGADSPLDFPYVYHWPGASTAGNPPREEIERFGEQDLVDDLNGNKKPRVKGSTSTGVAMSTDGQRVFVTNWPDSLGGKTTEKPAEERQPIWSASIRAFDQGGFRDAHIAPDGADLIRYAEKGTGGEAYIPLSAAKRGRSVGLTREVAHRFGFELVPMEDGGLTGFGGYAGERGATFDVPLTGEGWAAMSPNKRRATMYNLAALGIGGAFAIASGFDENGAFTGQFDTGANSHPGLEKAFGDWADRIAEQLEAIKKAAENPNPVDVQVDIDSGSRTAQIEITKRGL
ncbi:phage tail tape measure protein [Rhodococcus pyridinivorans]|uniref:phage tail tape measure protein n=1 Tax=Rhodococcus pyridinivorans TaxID=103816 RepID=UPI003D7F6A7D